MGKEDYLANLEKSAIQEYLDKFNKTYFDDENIVATAFTALDDSSVYNIASKAIVLNNRYSAGLNSFASKKDGVAIDVFGISKLLFHYELGTDLIDEEKAIDIIKNINIECSKRKKKNTTSFLSKYIYWHNHACGCDDNNVPIYDSHVKALLYLYNRKRGNPYRFRMKDILEYIDFCSIHNEFVEYCNKITNSTFSGRDIDKFLWLQGKEKKLSI